MKNNDVMSQKQLLKVVDIPIRIDSTLYEPGEVWLEEPDGTVHLLIREGEPHQDAPQ